MQIHLQLFHVGASVTVIYWESSVLNGTYAHCSFFYGIVNYNRLLKSLWEYWLIPGQTKDSYSLCTPSVTCM